MGTLTVPVTEEGILIPKLAARLLGARAGDWAQVEVTLLPSSEELKNKALHYALHRLGDAVYTGEPVWAEDGWSLPIKVLILFQNMRLVFTGGAEPGTNATAAV